MINKLIELSLKNRVLVIAAYIGLGMWGWWALSATPIDAIPDYLTTRSSSSPTGLGTALRRSRTRLHIRSR